MPTKAERLLAKGQALEKRGKSAKALEFYRDACRAEPYDPDLWTARAEAARALEMHGEAAESLFHVCDLYARSGMVSEALEVVKRVLALDGGHGGARRFKRMLEQRLAERGEAEAEQPVPERIPTADPFAISSGAMIIEMDADDPADEAEITVSPEPAAPVPMPESTTAKSAAPPPATTRPPRAVVAEGLEYIGDSLDSISLVERLPSRPAESNGAASAAVSEIPLDDEPRFDVVRAVASTLSTSPLLSELDSDLVRHLIDAGKLVHKEPDEVVFRQGQMGNSLYLILSGEIAVIREARGDTPGRELARLRAGAFFGEMALLTNTPRSATITAVRKADFLEISRKAVRELIDRDPRVLKLLMRFFRARLVGTLLQTSPLFKAFSREERKKLVSSFRLRELGADNVVIREGSPGEGLYMVLAGKLEVVQAFRAAGKKGKREGDGSSLLLGSLAAGDLFGEMSLLDGSAAMATVRTRARSWVLLLPTDDYQQVVTRHPTVREHLERLAGERREKNEALLAQGPPPVAEGRLEPV